MSVADVVHDVPGGVDIGGGVGGPDAGDGLAGGLGEVGEPVGAGGGQLAGVGEQDADVAVGLVAAGTGSAQGGQDGIGGLPGGVHRAQVACGGGHERGSPSGAVEAFAEGTGDVVGLLSPQVGQVRRARSALAIAVSWAGVACRVGRARSAR